MNPWTEITEKYGIKNLRLKFPQTEKLLFKDVTFTFNKGEKILIVGPSGSGKSTLLQVLSGLIPHSIQVPIKTDAANLPESRGIVFQDPDSQFCMPYVDEEIAFVLENLQIAREDMDQYISSYLEKVGLRLATSHQQIRWMSGGMKQRAAIASVLALEPEVLFLDEPTALLDREGTQEVWNTIKSISRDRTVIAVEHKIDQAIDFADRMIVMNEQGLLIADGRPQDILTEYKGVLDEQGIWHPGVWKSYLEKKEKQESYPLLSEPPVLSVSNLNAVRGRTSIIQAEELCAYRGEWVTVTGKNGAGKSTLLHALMGLVKSTGDIMVCGKKKTKTKSIANEVQLVFQNPEHQFVTQSVQEEVAHTLRLHKWDSQKAENRVQELLSRFHLTSKKNMHPYQLSMGQKRRLSLAAALAAAPSVLLLDEPTFGQDAKNTFAILDHLEELKRLGTAIIMVTHDENIVKHLSTKTWHAADGTIIEMDSFQDRGEVHHG
ncbi:ATP-binding cassette domain-containing protein [Halobacillus salinarum]|uniref:ATP-binding cassette domain-containing protein n=1 Tax=Halobacillus salinarum TaxID=2932257 RepID=A0ABY4EDU1_9BACI|nr:ATP-binding cassette domain-containing protein [Halobacillus salinarum]UOQ42621.1 ATP-binding cassette domain-containing protein [Halobacillus salinarum]